MQTRQVQAWYQRQARQRHAVRAVQNPAAAGFAVDADGARQGGREIMQVHLPRIIDAGPAPVLRQHLLQLRNGGQASGRPEAARGQRLTFG